MLTRAQALLVGALLVAPAAARAQDALATPPTVAATIAPSPAATASAATAPSAAASAAIPTVDGAAVAVHPAHDPALHVDGDLAGPHTGQPVALMIVGGAAFLAGAIIGGSPGTIIMIGGAAVGLYGLYLYLQ